MRETYIFLPAFYELGCMLLPCLFSGISSGITRNFDNYRAYRIITSLVFIAYIFAVIHVTGIGTVWDPGHYDALVRTGQLNLVPLKAHRIRGYVLNIILFMPLGFLLPFMSRRLRNPLAVVTAGFVFSACIEASQLLNLRATDIDDLIMNTAGTAAGFLIWLILYLASGKKAELPGTRMKYEPVTWTALSFAGVFFLYNPWL